MRRRLRLDRRLLARLIHRQSKPVNDAVLAVLVEPVHPVLLQHREVRFRGLGRIAANQRRQLAALLLAADVRPCVAEDAALGLWGGWRERLLGEVRVVRQHFGGDGLAFAEGDTNRLFVRLCQPTPSAPALSAPAPIPRLSCLLRLHHRRLMSFANILGSFGFGHLPRLLRLRLCRGGGGCGNNLVFSG